MLDRRGAIRDWEGIERASLLSIVTFTTLGYGDIVVQEGGRVGTALEAAAGIVIFGWTTALALAAVQRISRIPRPEGEETQ